MKMEYPGPLWDYQPDNTPEWLKQHNQETATQKARTEAAAQRRQKAAVSIEVAGPDYWKRLRTACSSMGRHWRNWIARNWWDVFRKRLRR
jgi:hypothetical protein